MLPLVAYCCCRLLSRGEVPKPPERLVPGGHRTAVDVRDPRATPGGQVLGHPRLHADGLALDALAQVPVLGAIGVRREPLHHAMPAGTPHETQRLTAFGAGGFSSHLLSPKI